MAVTLQGQNGVNSPIGKWQRHLKEKRKLYNENDFLCRY